MNIRARSIGLLLPLAWLAWCLSGQGGEPAPTPAVPAPERGGDAVALRPEPALPGALAATGSDASEAEPVGSAIIAGDREPPQTPSATATRVRVTVRLPADAPECGLPVPELLRLDRDGTASPVNDGAAPPHRHPALELAARASRGEPTRLADQASRTFGITEPGRYVAAWHLWLQVPGTRTWRVQRGCGPELDLSLTDGAREVVVDIGAEHLGLDPSLDARSPAPHYRITPKDG